MKTASLLLSALLPLALAPIACATAVRGFDEGDGGDDTGGTGTTTSTNTGTNTGTSTECGDGNIDPGETCDPPSSCPVSCDDGNTCTADVAQGSAATCNLACSSAAITACLPDGCCPAGCSAGNDPDCTGCGNGEIEPGEVCDDGNASNTDDCLDTCLAASCGDGFLHAGFEVCDDGNNVNFDGCSASCSGTGATFGPVHTFANLSSSFYVTQFGCSNTGGDPAGDALWFCQHFYNATCTVQPVWMATQSSADPKMHSGTNCNNPDPGGVSVPNTSCVGGPCKIGSYPGSLGGLANLICDCP